METDIRIRNSLPALTKAYIKSLIYIDLIPLFI